MRKVLILFLLLVAASNSLFAQSQKTKKVEATYKNFVVYTGKTDYIFKRIDNGEDIFVIVSNDEEMTSPSVPKGLIDDDKNLEGLPGAHPKMLGKSFIIFFNEQNEVTEVIHKPKKTPRPKKK